MPGTCKLGGRLPLLPPGLGPCPVLALGPSLEPSAFPPRPQHEFPATLWQLRTWLLRPHDTTGEQQASPWAKHCLTPTRQRKGQGVPPFPPTPPSVLQGGKRGHLLGLEHIHTMSCSSSAPEMSRAGCWETWTGGGGCHLPTWAKPKALSALPRKRCQGAGRGREGGGCPSPLHQAQPVQPLARLELVGRVMGGKSQGSEVMGSGRAQSQA